MSLLDDDFFEDDFSSDSDNEHNESFESSEPLFEENLSQKNQLEISIDSEFESRYSISCQFLVKGIINGVEVDFIVIVIDSSFQSHTQIDSVENFCKEHKVFKYYHDLASNQTDNILLIYLVKVLQDYYKIEFTENVVELFINCWFYFSLKDLNISFGPENMREIYSQKNSPIIQRRSTSGKLKFEQSNILNGRLLKAHIFLKDLYGIDKVGLKKMADAFGVVSPIPNTINDVLEPYKTKMTTAIKEKPLDFVTYAINDVIITYALSRKIPDSFNKMLIEVFKITDPKEHLTPTNMPLTMGSIIHLILQKNIKHNVLKNDTSLMLALCKMGILEPNTKQYDLNLATLTLLKKFGNLNSLRNLKNTDSMIYKQMEPILKRSNWALTSLEYASSKSLIQKSVNTSLYSGAMISGGRTVNERPKECYIQTAADPDISGAYSSRLKKLGLVFGKPRLIYYSNNEKSKMTVAKFFATYEKELKSNLYKLTVSGKLSFSQDIIFSRDLSEKTIYNNMQKFQIDDSSSVDVSKPLVLLRSEIVQGTITHSIWEVIQKVATSQEKKEFNNLEVNNAIFWLDSDRVGSIEELADECLKDTGDYSYDSQKGLVTDDRTYKWYYYEFGELIDKLIAERAKYKKLKTPEGDSIQQVLKLTLNIIYGIICSRFFSLNNVVIADMITSSIRMSCWLMNKALNTYQSITDGGPCSLMKVTSFKRTIRKPGIYTLSCFEKYSTHDSLIIKPLADKNWEEIYKTPEKIDVGEIEKLINEHVKSFWLVYGIIIDFNLEVKNIISHGSYFMKAHYMFMILNNKTKKFDQCVVKIRGFRLLPEGKVPNQNPMYYLLQHILNNGPNTIFVLQNNGIYQSEKIVHLASWKKLCTKKNNKYVYEPMVDLLPGDSIIIGHYFKLNNLHFHLDTMETFRKRNNRGNSSRTFLLEDNTKKKLSRSLFEKYLNKMTVQNVLIRMDRDNLR